VKILKSFDDFISKIETSFLIGVIIFMFSIAFLDMSLRAFHTGFLWSGEVLRHLVLWICFVGASLATKYDRHIRMDILTRHVSEKWRLFLHVLSSLASCGVCLVLTYASTLTVLEEYHDATSSNIFNIPMWVLQIIIPIGFSFMTFRFFLELLGKTSDYLLYKGP